MLAYTIHHSVVMMTTTSNVYHVLLLQFLSGNLLCVDDCMQVTFRTRFELDPENGPLSIHSHKVIVTIVPT